MKWYVSSDPDGAQRFEFREDGDAAPDGASPVPREPVDGEKWNEETGKFVLDTAIAADMAVPAGHIDEAHLLKRIEAVVVLSGLTLTHGLLADEATALGIPINELAAQVHAKGSEMRATEIGRRNMKAQGKK